MANLSEPKKWTPSCAEGRWCGFGPYYAMFPVEFVRRQIETFVSPGSKILDPFCGRGTVPFVGQVTGHQSIGADVNPVAWLFATVKLDPLCRQESIIDRVDQVLESIVEDDRVPANEFQSHAWHPGVLAFLNAARRELNWKRTKVDRTLMGLILVHLHAKLGEGLSNQMRQAKSMAPEYSVRWWQARKMAPPKIDIRKFFQKKLHWRYAKGIPCKCADAKVFLGDARKVLKKENEFGADFILTSPPYCGVTNYEYDNWIRLWMLGGPALPSFRHASRYEDRVKYKQLLNETFGVAKSASIDDVIVYVRTDSREFTRTTTINTLQETWPTHSLYSRCDKAAGPTQTALFGNEWDKVGEVDLLMLPQNKDAPNGFKRSIVAQAQ